MHRFFIESPDIKDNVIEITDVRIVFQLGRVLRMRRGEKISIFDIKGNEFSIELLDLDKRRILGNILEMVKKNTESEIHVSIYQGIPKKPALFELVVQKATEIGVTEIYPLITKRTEKQRLAKFDRVNAIAMEAVEQSGRTKIPVIHHPINFEDAIKNSKNAYVAFEYEDKKMLSDFLPEIKKSKRADIFIGPEGGFEQTEIDFAYQNNAKMFSFGPRILRTETAAISAASIILLS